MIITLTSAHSNTSLLVRIINMAYLQFHNCSWECAFGREVGFSPDNPLAVNPAVTPEVADAIPPSWQPDNILEDFQEFWENLDSINEMLDANL